MMRTTEIPLTPLNDLPETDRSRLRKALSRVPRDTIDIDRPWALRQSYHKAKGKIEPRIVPRVCAGPEITSAGLVCDASPDIQDTVGGIAWALVRESLAEGMDIATAARPWFNSWHLYILPQGAVLCPKDPGNAIDVLQAGFGLNADLIEDKVVSGAFCALAPTDLSNHERITFADEASRLVGHLATAERADTGADLPLIRFVP